MKKILAIVLALVMMLAVTVPAFAEDVTISNESAGNTGNADVLTTFDADDWSYTVTYPANTNIAWNDKSPVNADYAVTSQLLIGASLKVSVSRDNDGKMTTTPDKGFSLTYTLTGGTEETFAEINDNEGPATPVEISISDFSGVPVGTYTGTVTYTVEYVAPAE